ncbi:hypothetical protein Veis_3300 [Verminephrobacter eiseniae EF01-2]|uniref:Uncharacterized protein n=1 Tax=Verminephrobacter eiseniae (strain EF01-2) TaxID=391735 RepID=A1WN23_VEREI|nr:hypothetical protein Veis_3300 [Verminephrobacter eiseniae EF01-2]
MCMRACLTLGIAPPIRPQSGIHDGPGFFRPWFVPKGLGTPDRPHHPYGAESAGRDHAHHPPHCVAGQGIQAAWTAPSAVPGNRSASIEKTNADNGLACQRGT